MKSITLRVITPLLLALALMFSFAVVPMSASAHDGEDHSEESSDEMEQKRQLIIKIIGLLQQLIEERGGDAMMTDGHDHDHEEMDDGAMDGSAELLISVEEHGGVTHVHVDELGKDEVSFFLEDIDISDEAAVIAAIAAETGFSEAEVEAAATFASHDDMDLSGIHIMGDGSVMLGNGETLHDATVNDEGMIVLADGTEVEPTMDMRDGDEMDHDEHDDHNE